ncbi:hypothetical protein M1L21_37715 [Streptomyces sp. AS02]|nr:hypothetical protein [Streptomyces sp. AS02]
MGEDVLDGGVEGLLDPAAPYEVLAEGLPGLSHPLHGHRIGVLDHGFHLVHVVVHPEWSGVLFREALLRVDVLVVVGVFVAHGYCPLISM